MKKVLFTHTDLDGAGCAVVFNAFRLKYDYQPDVECQIIYCNNGVDTDIKIIDYISAEDFNKDNTEIFIADLGPSEYVFIILKDISANVKVFDHHITNTWAKKYFDDAIVTTEGNCCGASLLYDHLCTIAPGFKNHNLLIDHFVDTVRSYDTYEWKKTNNIEARRLNALFKLLGMSNFVDEFTIRMATPFPYVENHYGVELIRKAHEPFVKNTIRIEEELIDSIVPEKVITNTIKGYKCAIKYLDDNTNVSELGNQFLTRYPEYDVFIGIYLNSKIVSYRSKEIDCANEFAVPMGGGGHKFASGNKLSDEDLQKVTDTILQKLLQKPGCDGKNKNRIGFFDHLVGNA